MRNEINANDTATHFTHQLPRYTNLILLERTSSRWFGLRHRSCGWDGSWFKSFPGSSSSSPFEKSIECSVSKVKWNHRKCNDKKQQLHSGSSSRCNSTTSNCFWPWTKCDGTSPLHSVYVNHRMWRHSHVLVQLPGFARSSWLVTEIDDVSSLWNVIHFSGSGVWFPLHERRKSVHGNWSLKLNQRLTKTKKALDLSTELKCSGTNGGMGVAGARCSVFRNALPFLPINIWSPRQHYQSTIGKERTCTNSVVTKV